MSWCQPSCPHHQHLSHYFFCTRTDTQRHLRIIPCLLRLSCDMCRRSVGIKIGVFPEISHRWVKVQWCALNIACLRNKCKQNMVCIFIAKAQVASYTKSHGVNARCMFVFLALEYSLIHNQNTSNIWTISVTEFYCSFHPISAWSPLPPSIQSPPSPVPHFPSKSLRIETTFNFLVFAQKKY